MTEGCLRYINCSLWSYANFLACPLGEGAERSEAEGGCISGGELMKKLLSALACGVLLLFGGMSVVRADYYEMYNPATHVEVVLWCMKLRVAFCWI